MISTELRAFKIEDAESLSKHANNINVAGRLTDAFPNPYTLKHAKDFIQKTHQAEPVTVFAIAFENEVIGGIGLHPQQDIYRKNAELGYWLSEAFWGKGIIAEKIKEIVDFGFSNLDIDRIYARPFGSNKASQRVLEKAGFTLEATLKGVLIKNEQREDEMIYAIRK